MANLGSQIFFIILVANHSPRIVTGTLRLCKWIVSGLLLTSALMLNSCVLVTPQLRYATPDRVIALSDNVKKSTIAELDTMLAYELDTAMYSSYRLEGNLCKRMIDEIAYMAYPIRDFVSTKSRDFPITQVFCTYDEGFLKWPFKNSKAQYFIVSDTTLEASAIKGTSRVQDLIKADLQYAEKRGKKPKFKYKPEFVIEVNVASKMKPGTSIILTTVWVRITVALKRKYLVSPVGIPWYPVPEESIDEVQLRVTLDLIRNRIDRAVAKSLLLQGYKSTLP